MKKILISGGAGFIGSSLTRHLLKQFYDVHVTCLDNFDDFYSRSLKEKNIQDFLGNEHYCLIDGDIMVESDLAKVGQIDCIIHLAAKAGVRESLETPLIYHDINYIGTVKILEFAKKRNIKKVIFASSSSVYGENPNLPWREDEKVYPVSHYACSKLASENLGYVYARLFDINFIALRFFTVYGPRQRPDLAISKFFNSIIEDQPINAFGDGATFRNYTYIDDVIQGIISALYLKECNYEVINIAGNSCVSLKDLIREMESVCGKTAKIKWLPDRAGDVRITHADLTKAKACLNYSPETDLKTGLQLFYNWLMNQRLYHTS